VCLCRHQGEGLRPIESVDSAEPVLMDTDCLPRSGNPKPHEEDDDCEPLSMANKSGFRQWPPYKHTLMTDASEEDSPDEEPQPLTQEIKGGALPTEASVSGCSSPEASALAPKPPASPFRVSTCPSRECCKH
jgi:hypothetical protein